MPRHVEFNQTGGPDVLQIVEADLLAPPSGHVQIDIKAAGLNRAELIFFQGQYLVQPRLPGARLGFEGAGVIVDTGPDITGWSVGDRVCVTPAFQQDAYGVIGERINIPATALEPIPDCIDFVDAAAFWMAFGTAYGLLVQTGGLQRGDGKTVVFNAASSSVGLALIQVAQAHGATTVALTRTGVKAGRLFEAGADHVILADEEDSSARILEITEGRGFDIACDAVGGPATTMLGEAAGFESTIIQYGLLSGEVAPVPTNAILGKAARLTGFHLLWHMMNLEERRALASCHLRESWTAGMYKTQIDRRFGFDDTSEAYRYMASNDQFGKIFVEL
ncbi:MAG: zinc-dependent alcohol dehydrogenase family protein [Pseudomonadota bacterium]